MGDVRAGTPGEAAGGGQRAGGDDHPAEGRQHDRGGGGALRPDHGGDAPGGGADRGRDQQEATLAAPGPHQREGPEQHQAGCRQRAGERREVAALDGDAVLPRQVVPQRPQGARQHHCEQPADHGQVPGQQARHGRHPR